MKDSSGRTSLAARGRRKSGFTLIEMAISIVIVGLLAAPAIQAYNNYMKTQRRITTTENINAVMSAIQTYRLTNGTFPCPSGLNLAHTSVNYGVPVACTSADPLATTPVLSGCTAAGVCVEQSTRVAVPAFTAYQKRVVVGAVPFRLLQIDEKQTYDGYGSRLVYAVTQSMADIQTLSSANGAISMQNQPGAVPPAKSLINPPNSAVFVVLSPGPDRVGGFTRDGKVARSCTGAVGLDSQNCNPGFEGGAARVNALFVHTFENSAVGANHFDDQMNYFESQADPLWRLVPNSNPPNIQDLTKKNVGVDLPTGTAPAVTLDIGPAINLTNTDSLLAYGNTANGNTGAINVGKVVDTNPAIVPAGSASFVPAMIGGVNGIQCPGNGANQQYMLAVDGTKLGNGVATAKKAQCVSNPKVFCPGIADPPTSTVLNGFMADGTPICKGVPNPPCPATNFSICSANDVVLSSTPDTQQSSLFGPLNAATGGCRSVRYTCNAGTWSKTTDNNSGYCSFTPLVTHPPCSCATQLGLGFTGTCTATNTTLCPSGSTTTYNTSGCTCGGAQSFPDQSQPCPAPWVNNGALETRTVNTDASCNIQYGAWNTSACTCGLSTTQYDNCANHGAFNSGNQAFQTRTVTQSNCTASGWSAWDVSGCSCNAPSPVVPFRLYDGGWGLGVCPPNMTGTYYINQTWSQAACSYQSGTTFGCSCDTTTHQSCSQPHDCSALGADCYTPTNDTGYYTNVFTAPNSCVPGACQIQSQGTCNSLLFSLQSPSKAGPNTGGASSPNPGDPCQCSDHRKTEANQPVVCYEKTDLSNIYTCSCQ